MSPSEYDHFATVYDQREHRIVAEAFHRRLRRLLTRVPRGACVVDLGCGTGMLTTLLAGDGFTVIGVDHSSHMLRIAARRCRPYGSRVRLVHGDFSEAASVAGSQAAIAVACGDVVNHLGSTTALRALFTAARRSLRHDGVLAFDALNVWCFRTYWNQKTYLYEGNSGDLLMQCSWNARRRIGTARIVGYVRDHAATYRRRETTLREYLHENTAIGAHSVLLASRCMRSASGVPGPTSTSSRGTIGHSGKRVHADRGNLRRNDSPVGRCAHASSRSENTGREREECKESHGQETQPAAAPHERAQEVAITAASLPQHINAHAKRVSREASRLLTPRRFWPRT